MILYQGAGRGKSCAAWGHVWRALGRHQQVAVVVFAQPLYASGEQLLAQVMPQLTYWLAGDTTRDVASPACSATHAAQCIDAWLYACSCIAAAQHNLLVLDDLPALLQTDGMHAAQVANVLRARPPNMHVILTGTAFPAVFADLADSIVELQAQKTPPKPHCTLGLDC